MRDNLEYVIRVLIGINSIVILATGSLRAVEHWKNHVQVCMLMPDHVEAKQDMWLSMYGNDTGMTGMWTGRRGSQIRSKVENWVPKKIDV